MKLMPALPEDNYETALLFEFCKLASNASMRILAYFCEAADWPASQKCLLVTFPQTPKIVNSVDGYAFIER